ncbi:ras-related C3 botulinum toxin substrate 1-like [Symsagittifera roscoffensis]|uniref:ras-related C3 botulinum toxin substrate 1-like n=1 Tax=Symsagittifera roscoffensis TaxID=84072 RepID=UPI00307B6F7E
MQSVKCVLVGDGAVGKTCMLIRLTQNHFPTQYVPTVFDTYDFKFTVHDRPVCLKLWDTAGQEDYDRLRPLSYSGTDVFLLCYSIDSPTSLENCCSKWIHELRHYCDATVPIVLVGTKMDLRKQSGRLKCVRSEEGAKMAYKIGANKHTECSAQTDEGLRDVFVEAVELVLTKPKQNKKKKKCEIF